jgi:PAS domain S-box-containing protein
MTSKPVLPLDQVLMHLVRSRLFVPLLLVSLAALVVSGLVGVEILENQQQQNVQERAIMIDRYIDQADRMLDAVARVAAVSTPDETRTYLQGTLGAYRYFDTLYLLDNQSRIVQMVPPDIRYMGLDMTNMPSYRMAGDRNISRISRPFISLRTGNPTVYIIRDLPSGDSIIGELNLDALQQDIAASSGNSGQDFIFILDQYGTLIAHPSVDLVRQQTNFGNLNIFRQDGTGPSTLFYDYGKSLVLGSAMRVDRTGWLVVDQVPVLTAFGPYALILGLTVLVLICIWFILAIDISRRLRREVIMPLEDLSRRVTALTTGDFGQVSHSVMESSAFSELDRLAADFRLMNSAIQERQVALGQSRDDLIRKNEDLHAAYEQLTAREEDLRENFDELKKTEDALRQSEYRLRGVADNIPGVVFQFYARPSGERGLNYVNGSSVGLMGLGNSPEDFPTRFTASIVPEDRLSFLASVDEAVRGESRWEWEGRYVRPDGSEMSIQGIADPVKQGNELVFSGVLLDTTERKWAEEAVRKSGREWQVTFNAITDAVFLLDNQNRIVRHNRALETFLGKPAGEIDGRYCHEIMHGTQHLLNECPWVKAQESRQRESLELKIGDRWLVALIDPVFSDNGELSGCVHLLIDITERKRVEIALSESEQRLNDIINFLPDATFAIDREGKVIAWNKAVERMTAVKGDDILGKGNYEHSLPFYGKRRPILIDLIFEDIDSIKSRYVNVKRDGNFIIAENFVPGIYQGNGAYIWAIASPFYDTKGNVIGAIESIRDITNQKMSQDALDQARKKLNLLNAVTFQDIQNAVFSLSGYFDLEKEFLLDEKQRQYKEKESILIEQISESLKYAKTFQSLGLRPPVWQNVGQSFLFGISHTDISKLNRQLEIDGVEIYADQLLENVFFALADNIVQHGKTATAYSLTYQETSEGLSLVFEDNGAGIPDDLKEKIFEREYGRRKGIGLYLSREILSVTGITIRETGGYGKGARFEILVPKDGYRFISSDTSGL